MYLIDPWNLYSKSLPVWCRIYLTNGEKTMSMFISRRQKAEQIHNLQISNKYIIKCLGKIVSNQCHLRKTLREG
jgi:hypothetical protein